MRLTDVFDLGSPMRHGAVTRRYAQRWRRPTSDWPVGYDPELYEVRWDDGVVQKGFFSHGLDPE